MRSNHHVIGFVGPSSVGKTTLLEAIVPELQRRGLWVGVVKHSRHEVDVDRPGKDSARLNAAGADREPEGAGKSSTSLRLCDGDPGRIRTYDTQLRRLERP